MEKIYLVSFGNSDQYLLRDNAAGEESVLTRIESKLNAYLKEKFPNETFAYFTTPKVTEVSELHAEQFASYPVLDEKALVAIKDVLSREVANMEANSELDDNAPFANVNPAAADIPHILG